MWSDLEQAVQKEWLVGQHLEIWGSAGEERAVYIPGLSLEMEGREWKSGSGSVLQEQEERARMESCGAMFVSRCLRRRWRRRF